jgi:predicted GNAT family acetyltransferase
MAAEVTDNRVAHRFEMVIGEVVAFVVYRTEGGRLVLTHTEVPAALAGQGIGSKLVRGVLDRLRATARRWPPAAASSPPTSSAILSTATC